MIALIAAVLAAATSCTSVSGADQLWQPGKRWVIVGEMHGTNEAPDAFANLACLAAATGRPVTVGLEYSADGQAIIDAYIASNGDEQARADLMTLREFSASMQDGRGSVAFLRLFDTLRRMKQTGQITGVVAFDVGRSTPSDKDRNAVMAQTWLAIPARPNGVILALVGNLHAMRKPVTFSGRTIVTAGSLMPARRTVTVNVDGNGGQAWNCQADGCGAHDNGRSKQEESRITYSTDPDRQWDATYELGVPTTGAPPAQKRK